MAWSEKYNQTDVGKVRRFIYEQDRDFAEVWDAVVRGLGSPDVPPAIDYGAISSAADRIGVEVYQRRTSRSPRSIKWCVPAGYADTIAEDVLQQLTENGSKSGKRQNRT